MLVILYLLPPHVLNYKKIHVGVEHQARVVRKVDNAFYRINHYPLDGVVCFVIQLDSALSGG